MATFYKAGSKGEDVRRIQQALVRVGCGDNMKIDGDYGPKTAEAVRLFQQQAGLKPVDGIVGPVTMARLMAASVAATAGLRITDARINQHVTFSVGRPLRYIAIHYTAGGNSRRGAAMQNRNVFLKRSASADFVVDDETVVQVNPDIRNYYCWAVGDKLNPYSGGGRLNGKATNKNTISVEVCSTLRAGTTAAVPNHDGWSFSEKALDLTLRLVRHLMQQYGIPRENVIRHYDVTGKACPGIPGWNDAPLYTTDGRQTTAKNNSSEWERFLAAL